MVRAAAKRDRIVELWAAGATLREIAEDLGTTPATVGMDVSRMRARGYELAYRRGGPRAAAAAQTATDRAAGASS